MTVPHDCLGCSRLRTCSTATAAMILQEEDCALYDPASIPVCEARYRALDTFSAWSLLAKPNPNKTHGEPNIMARERRSKRSLLRKLAVAHGLYDDPSKAFHASAAQQIEILEPIYEDIADASLDDLEGMIEEAKGANEGGDAPATKKKAPAKKAAATKKTGGRRTSRKAAKAPEPEPEPEPEEEEEKPKRRASRRAGGRSRGGRKGAATKAPAEAPADDEGTAAPSVDLSEVLEKLDTLAKQNELLTEAVANAETMITRLGAVLTITYNENFGYDEDGEALEDLQVDNILEEDDLLGIFYGGDAD